MNGMLSCKHTEQVVVAIPNRIACLCSCKGIAREREWLNLSIRPSPCEWQAVVWDFTIPNGSKVCHNIALQKFAPDHGGLCLVGHGQTS